MIIYINGEGTAEKLYPQHIYQGSNISGIYVCAPYPAGTAVSAAFRLPDGTVTPYYAMTLSGQEAEAGVAMWQFTLPRAITQKAGRAALSFMAQFGSGSGGAYPQQTSVKIEFDIEPSVSPGLPDEPTPDAWAVITAKIAEIEKSVSDIQSTISGIEQTAGEAKDTAENAKETAENAVKTANEAENTANGLDAQIKSAVETANDARQTAGEAATTASKAEATANGLDAQIKSAIQTAGEAVTTANKAEATANGLDAQIKTANNTAEFASMEANEAKQDAQRAIDIAQGAADRTGTPVYIDNQLQTRIEFSSAPQEQIDNRVRYDAPQTLTNVQKATVRNNIGYNTGLTTLNPVKDTWYTIAHLRNNHIPCIVQLTGSWTYSSVSEATFICSFVTKTSNRITQISGSSDYTLNKIRLRGESAGNTGYYIDVLFRASIIGSSEEVRAYIIPFPGNDSSEIQAVPFTEFNSTEAWETLELEVKDNFNTTGNIYARGQAVPAALTLYPVGSIYMSAADTSPASFIGGTWERWGAGRVPVGLSGSESEFDTAEKTGGEKAHALTLDEIPAHDHSGAARSGSGGYTLAKPGDIATSGVPLGSQTYSVEYEMTSLAGSGNGAPSSSLARFVEAEYGVPSNGGGGSHTNLQPYIVCYMWKRIA